MRIDLSYDNTIDESGKSKSKLRDFVGDLLRGELFTFADSTDKPYIMGVYESEEAKCPVKDKELLAVLGVKDGSIYDFGDFMIKVETGNYSKQSINLYLCGEILYNDDIPNRFERLIVEEAIPSTLFMNTQYQLISGEDCDTLCLEEAKKAISFLGACWESGDEAVLEGIDICFRNDKGNWISYCDDETPKLYWRNGWIYAVYRRHQPLILNPRNARL